MMMMFIPEIFGVSLEVYFILLILGLPTYYFWKWLLKKYINSEKNRKIITWALTVLVTPFLYVGIALLLIFSICYYPNHDFDRQKWISNREKRYELSKDIMESKMLIGKNKTEIRKLFGDEGNSDTSDKWSYYLGFRPGIANIDPDYLDIEFKDGKVVSVSQHES